MAYIDEYINSLGNKNVKTAVSVTPIADYMKQFSSLASKRMSTEEIQLRQSQIQTKANRDYENSISRVSLDQEVDRLSYLTKPRTTITPLVSSGKTTEQEPEKATFGENAKAIVLSAWKGLVNATRQTQAGFRMPETGGGMGGMSQALFNQLEKSHKDKGDYDEWLKSDERKKWTESPAAKSAQKQNAAWDKTQAKLLAKENRIAEKIDIENKPKLVQFMAGAMESLPMTGMSALGGMGYVLMFNQAMRNSFEYNQKRIENGENISESDVFINSMGNGAIEVVTEMLFDIMDKSGLIPKGTGTNLVRGIKKWLKIGGREVAERTAKEIGQMTVKELGIYIARKANEEGIEEIIGALGGGVLAKFTTDKDVQLLGKDKESLISFMGIIESYAGGFIGGSMFAGTSTTAQRLFSNYTQAKVGTESMSLEEIAEKPELVEKLVDALAEDMQNPETRDYVVDTITPIIEQDLSAKIENASEEELEQIVVKQTDAEIATTEPTAVTPPKTVSEVKAQSNAKGKSKAVLGVPQSVVEPSNSKVYYRGTTEGGKRSITGNADWDNNLFASTELENAKLYGNKIEIIKPKDNAKILVEGTSEFKKVFGKQKQGAKLLDWLGNGVKESKNRGYDIVEFKRQGDTGTVILNEKSVVRNYSVEPTKATAKPTITKQQLSERLSRNENIDNDLKKWLKTEEAQKDFKDVNTPEDVVRRVAELTAIELAKPKSKRSDMFKFNLQLFAYKAKLEEMADKGTDAEKKTRRYLLHIIENSIQGKPEDVATKIREAFSSEEMLYEVFSNQRAVDEAKREIDSSADSDLDAEKLLDKIVENNEVPTPTEIVIINEYIKRLSELEDKTRYHSAVMRISEHATKGGRFIQSLRLLTATFADRDIKNVKKTITDVFDVPKADVNDVKDKANKTKDKMRKKRKDIIDGVADYFDNEFNDDLDDVIIAKKNIDETSPEILQKKIITYATPREVNKKVHTAEQKMIDELFKKAKEKMPKTTETEKMSVYEVLSFAAKNKELMADIWNKAQFLVNENPSVALDLKQGLMYNYLQTLANPVVADKVIIRGIRQAIKDSGKTMAEMVRQVAVNGSESLTEIRGILRSNMPALTDEQFNYISITMEMKFLEMMGEERLKAIEQLKRSYKLKQNSVIRTEQQVFIDMLSNVVFYNALEDADINEIWAKRLGVPILTRNMTEEIEQAIFAYHEAKTQDEKDTIYTKMIHTIAGQMRATTNDKVRAWMTTSMLLNPATLIRNGVSNLSMMPMWNITDVINNKLDKIARIPKEYRMSGDKTLTMKSNDPIIPIVQAKVTNEHIRNRLEKTDKFGAFGAMITRHMRISNNDTLENIRKWLPDLLTVGRISSKGVQASEKNPTYLGDFPAFKNAYMIAMANKMNALGYNSATTDSERQNIIDKSEEYAMMIAQERTYRVRTIISKVINGMKNATTDNKMIRSLESKGQYEKAKQVYNAGKFARTVLDVVYPFITTTASITKLSYEYSPVNLAFTLAYDVGIGSAKNKLKGKTMSAEKKAIITNKLAKGLAGTTVPFALGLALGALGFLTGSAPDNEKELTAWKLNGKREYSVYIPGVGSLSIDWLMPLATPMLMGAELWQLIDGDESMLDKILNGGESMINTLFINSIFENRTLQVDRYSEQGIGSQLVSNLAKSATSQAIPNVFKRFAKTLDPYARDPYSGTATMNYIYQFMSAVPFGTYAIPARVDIWGKPVRQVPEKGIVGFTERILLNMIAPFLVNRKDMDKTTREVMDVYNNTMESDGNIALPSLAKKSIDGINVSLKGKLYEEYARILGNYQYVNVNKVISSASYNSLSYLQKAKWFEKAYSNARAKAKEEFLKLHPELKEEKQK